MTRAVRVLGVVLLVVGSAAWSWVAMLEDPVDRVAAFGSEIAGGVGMVELELYVLDLRLAPLLVAVAGVGLLVAPSVPGYSLGVMVMTAAAGVALLVPAAAASLSAWWAGAAALAVLLAGIATFTILRCRTVTLRGEGERLSLPARRVTATVGLVLLCSAFPMEVFIDFDDSVLAALPDGYLVAVPVLEGLVLGSGMVALLMAARRLTWLHLLAACLVLAEMAAFLFTEASAAWLALTLLMVVIATAAAVAGEHGRVRNRAVALTAGFALLYPLVAYIAVFFAVGLGAIALGFNGGVIDYDGLPIFLTGPLSAALPAVLYLAGTAGFDITVEPRGADNPSVEPPHPSPEFAG